MGTITVEYCDWSARSGHDRDACEGHVMGQVAVTHFGVRVQRGSVHGLRLTRDTYTRVSTRNSLWFPRALSPRTWDARMEDFVDEDHRNYSEEWCTRARSLALENFDLNMAYFAQLDEVEFDDAVQTAVRSIAGVRVVTDLERWNAVPGVYVMVLDDYKQVYVGTTGRQVGVMKRIRQHWTNSKPLDRLVFGTVSTSILSIDSFRALDTTRIYAARTSAPFEHERLLLDEFPSKFTLNRVSGGDPRELGILHASGYDTIRERALKVVDDA
ncbi:hypothetical protein BKA24_001491 [Microbacterium marinum]|uniref:GIY-YIG domain-containing protein n=1 Tax=Microbacterium marinum TaxID=421115 RepID=A0A7W7BQ60_9MICO|nr:hypothetical protein [Microbacterium marinum]MBB4666782.1 hypothetical protein [Microbacterium marinum]